MTRPEWDSFALGVFIGINVALIVMPYSFVGWVLFFAADILGVVYAFVLRKGKGETENGKQDSGNHLG